MTEPLLRLDEFGLTDLEIHWHSNPENQKQMKSDFSIGYAIHHASVDPHKYRLRMSIVDKRSIDVENALAELSATMIGFFSFQQSITDEQCEHAIRVNGLTILYGALRGVLAGVTGVFPPGFRYVLPAVNILEIIENVEGKEKGHPVERKQAKTSRRSKAAPRSENKRKSPRA